MSTVIGGEKIGEGSYGCVFNPPLICKGNRYIKSTADLGKVTSKDDAENELRTAAILRDRPLSANYFILPEALICSIESLDKQIDPDITKCEAFKRIPLNDLRQFKMKYGGENISKYLQKLQSLNNFNFIEFCTHLLEGASLLALAGIVHYDLYDGNVLIDKAGVPRIIDWGFSFKADTITTDLINNGTPGWKTISGAQTNVEPPEITLATYVNHNHSVNNAIESILKGKPIIKDLKDFYLISLEEQRRQLSNFVEMSETFKKEDWGAMFRLHWSKFDSWSLGCLISRLFLRLLQSQSFYENTYKQNRKPIDKMLFGMLQINPFMRMDCLEALEVIDPNNKVLQRFGKKWLEERKKQKSAIIP